MTSGKHSADIHSATSSEGGEHLEKSHTQRTENGEPAEIIRTISRVPGNPNYYEKNGLRTYGDGMDHDHEQPMNFSKFMALVGMAFLWCGSQIPLYLYGGVIVIIYTDIGGSDIYTWAVIGYFIALAAVTPFVGSLSDLFGRREVAMGGSALICGGMVATALAHNMRIFIVGMVLAGAGAGICEMIALAGTGELVPTAKRGMYIGLIICTILPYCPSVLWAQLVAEYSWRWNGLWCGAWSFIGIILIAFFYWPPPRVNATGLSRKETLKRIDFVGALLSIAGLTLFLGGLQWGGQAYPWGSAHVLVPLILGLVLMGGFLVWEAYGAPYPMFPARLKQDPRSLYTILFITAVSGANFFAVLIFWPTQSDSMYTPDPIQVGIRSLPIGFGIIIGAVIVSVLITVLKGKIRLLLLVSCIVMTAGTGAMAIARTDNLAQVYAPLCFAAVGVGGVIIPNQIILTIITPDDLIATATALGLCARVIGGAIGFAVYYNVFKTKFTHVAEHYLAPKLVDIGALTEAELMTIAFDVSANLYGATKGLPGITTDEQVELIRIAGQETFAQSFSVVWYAAIGFGAATIVACLFLRDISKYMDGHVAVTMA